MPGTILYLHLLLAVMLLYSLYRRQPRLGAIAALLLVLTGGYNFMVRVSGAPHIWHAGMGVKILLALHAATVSLLLARGAEAARLNRWRRSALLTSVLAAAIGIYFSNFARR